MPLLLSDRAVLSSPITLITARDAACAGIRPSACEHHRVRPGVYGPKAEWDALAPWQRYAARVHALVLSHPGVALALESAAVVHGIPLFGETRDLHLFDPDRTKTTRFGDVVVHASANTRQLGCVGSIPVTSLVDTIVDLARMVPPAHALAAVDAVISPAQGGGLSLGQVRERAEGQSNRRGRARLRWLWPRASTLAESPAESVSRAVIEWAGFEEPVQQPEFHYEGHTDRTDFGFRSNQALCEADGWGKYELDDPARAREHLIREKRREDRLRRHGHPFARWEAADAFRVIPLCRALQGAGVREVHAPQPAMLATLHRTPRALPR